MMIKVAGPGGGAVHPLYLEDRKPKLPKWAWGAIGVSAALHLGAGAWLYYQKFVMPELAPPQDAPTVVDIIELPKPPPTEHPRQPPKQPPPIHDSKPQQQPIEILPVPPQPIRDTPDTSGPISQVVVKDPAPTGTAVEQPVAPAGPKVITRPRWVSRPSADQMARYYPPAALADGTEGAATLRCMVTVAGKVTGCQVMSETPRNRDFGKAALRLSKFFVMSPQTVDGEPVEGGQVTFIVKFTLQ